MFSEGFMNLNLDPAAGASAAISTIQNNRRGAHSVQFYEDDGYLVESLAESIVQAISAGGSCVMVATSAHRDRLNLLLEEKGLQSQSLREDGRYLTPDVLDTLATISIDGSPDRPLFNRVMGEMIGRARSYAPDPTVPVTVFGEMVAVLWERGRAEDAVRLEELWNDLMASHGFDLRCAYPMEVFDRIDHADALGQICASHSTVIPAESLSSLTADDRQSAIAILQHKAVVLEAEMAVRTRLLRAEREARGLAEAALKARDEFLSIASHELKTPITVLRGSAQLLQRRQTSGEIQGRGLTESLNLIESTAVRLGRLIDDLLDVSRIETGQLELLPEWLDLARLVERCVKQDGQQFAATHTFTFEQADEARPVWADPSRMEEVLTNLLSNAVKYSPDGGRVDVSVALHNGGHVLKVVDEGIGLPAGAAGIIFEPFGRARNATESELPGMGLGLYICRRIVEGHGGRIWAQSPGEGKGTSTFVWLPFDGSLKTADA